MLQMVAPCSAISFAGGVVMPNLISSVDSLQKIARYKKQILESCSGNIFIPYMTLFFRPYTKEELIAAQSSIIGIKLYPAGITTQSEGGISNFTSIHKTLSHMEELKIPLLVHGESNGFVMDREREFLEIIQQWAEKFPQLHIIIEHITTADAVTFIDHYPNVSATVTLHHLLISLDDVIGNALQPDLFCKPIAKRPSDRDALCKAVFSGHDKIMFGSDSAPHPRHKKECCGCAAGIFTAPVALPMLAELFEDEGKLDLLQNFISNIACRRYGLQPPKKTVTLMKKEWRVPNLYGDVKPFGAGKTLRWSIE